MWELLWFLTFPGNSIPMENLSPAFFTNQAACEAFKLDEIIRIERDGLLDMAGERFWLDEIEGDCRPKQQENENV